MPDHTLLHGITWGHTRGFTPLAAAAQRFSELHPGVRIDWKQRSLQAFADQPVEKLAESYDLLIIDHPWVGCAAATGCVLPLDKHLPEAYLLDQAAYSVGGSHASYYYKGHQWALAIDAATPAASYRPDLLDATPETWEELLALARSGRVAVPAIPIDLLMNFYMFCIAHGETPFQNEDCITGKHTGIKALETMREFYSLVDPEFFSCNPIAVAELMSSSSDYWYCPFAYCYSNYSRPGFARHLLSYAPLVRFGHSGHLRSTIGGTGLAVSAHSEHKALALEFAQWVVSPRVQSGLYVENGGQPGYRTAWKSSRANYLANDFFTTLLPVMDSGYMRPRYNGYLHFQDHAGHPLHEYLQKGGNAETTLEKLNTFYRLSCHPEPVEGLTSPSPRENLSHHHD